MADPLEHGLDDNEPQYEDAEGRPWRLRDPEGRLSPSHACTICGNPLEHTPKLGEWIMHPQCQREVAARVLEAEQRATRVVEADLRRYMLAAATALEYLDEGLVSRAKSELRALDR